MGRVFFILTTLSLILALLTNRAPSAASALLNSAESGVSLMLTLLGTMTLWSGLMEVLLRTGDVAKLGLLIRKLFGRHSRALPDADCWEAVGMNLAANVLGLGNAATPPGVSAAKQLAVHGEPGLRVLALLLVLNNSGLQVLPTTVLTLRQAAGAQHPADIWGAMLISSAAATAAGVILLGVYDKIAKKERIRMEKAAAVTLILTVLLILLRGNARALRSTARSYPARRRAWTPHGSSCRADGDAAHAFLDERLWADGASCTPAIAPDGNIEPAAGGRADAHPPPDDRVGQFSGAAGDFRAVRARTAALGESRRC